MKSPKVSVIMSTYNHELFVRAAVESVLAQEDVDFEFLIADDGSVDGTRDVVADMRDQRIRFFPHTVNRGACVATNELIQRSQGEFIALLNSDDMWVPGKLAKQMALFDEDSESSLGAVFGRASFMDKDGSAMPSDKSPWGTIFDQTNRNSGLWLRRFFDLGNCICHPTMLIRKRCYEEVGLYDSRLRQLPDFDMWIRLVKRYEIHICDEVLVHFRVLPGENVSWNSETNAKRTISEHFLIAEHFFDDVSKQQLQEGFRGALKIKDIPSSVHLEIEKVLLMLRPNQLFGPYYRLIGLLKMRELMGRDDAREVLLKSYAIDDRWLHDVMAR